MPKGWKKIGEGRFNKAYRSDDGRFVLKIPKVSNATDAPERAVRLWNEINSNISPPAHMVAFPDGRKAWVCPYIEGRQSTDSERAHALIDIYKRTGRIIIDANILTNFKTTPTGKVVCVDVGFALQLDKNRDQQPSGLTKKESEISLTRWITVQNALNEAFYNYPGVNIVTVTTIKALLYLKEKCPNTRDVSVLHQKDAKAITCLADSYDINEGRNQDSSIRNRKLEKEAMEIVQDLNQKKMPDTVKSINPANKIAGTQVLPTVLQDVKKALHKEIDDYIRSRCSIDDKGNTNITGWYRNKRLTTQKLAMANELKAIVNGASSLEEIMSGFQNKISTEKKPVVFADTFASCFTQCMAIVRNASSPQILPHENTRPPRL